MAIFKLSDIFGHRDLLQRLKDERDEYGMWRGSSVSESFADELSKNFGKNFGSDKVSLSDRRDFSRLGEHYDPSLNIVRANLKKTSPGILAHELGHAFTAGMEARGGAGAIEKGKYYARGLLGFLGSAAVTAGTADLVSSLRNKRSYVPGGILAGIGAAARIGSSISEYRDEARATSEGLKALGKTLDNPGSVRVHGFNSVPRSREKRKDALDSSKRTLEAALTTYKRAIPVETLLSLALSGGAGALIGRNIDTDAGRRRARMLIGAGSVASTALSAAILENSMRTLAGTEERDSQYEITEDDDVSILSSGRS